MYLCCVFGCELSLLGLDWIIGRIIHVFVCSSRRTRVIFPTGPLPRFCGKTSKPKAFSLSDRWGFCPARLIAPKSPPTPTYLHVGMSMATSSFWPVNRPFCLPCLNAESCLPFGPVNACRSVLGWLRLSVKSAWVSDTLQTLWPSSRCHAASCSVAGTHETN